MKKATIMIVDDEKYILNALRRLFRKSPYNCITFDSPVDALDTLETLDKNRPHVVISDRRMPYMEGIDFLTRVKGLYPDTYCILLTGYKLPDRSHNALKYRRIDRVIFKPWKDEDVKQEIEKALSFVLQY